MNPISFSVTVLGRPLLVVEFGPTTNTTTAQAEPAQDQSDDETPGPLTEHRAAPITQLGFGRGGWDS